MINVTLKWIILKRFLFFIFYFFWEVKTKGKIIGFQMLLMTDDFYSLSHGSFVVSNITFKI
jgi:hypothetical protein